MDIDVNGEVCSSGSIFACELDSSAVAGELTILELIIHYPSKIILVT